MSDYDSPTFVFERMMEKDYCSQWMGIKAVTLEKGFCKIKMKVKREMLNGFEILHGGIAFAFADSALAFAANSLGQQAVSIQAQMNYHKPAREGDELIAEARQVGHREQTGTFDVLIYKINNSDRPLYTFRGLVFRK